jgi:hypothetical protein
MPRPASLHRLSVVVLACSVFACSTVRPAPIEPAAHELASTSRPAVGSACGIDLLNLVPIGITHRAERARRNAIESSGAKTLLTQSVTDTSVDLMVATIQCSSVGGVAAF